MRIGIIAGEASGDILGAALMEAIQAEHQDCQFEGVGGPLMIAKGFNSLFPMERLAVMGLLEPLKRLPELLRIRKQLKQHFLHQPPALVLGIDSPDFNLDLCLALRRRGLLTAHYVSPSVWAWRQGRIKKIKKAIDMMLTLFPFEAAFYENHQVPVHFVGHPLADQIDLETNTIAAREALGYHKNEKLITLMPGSRRGEVALMGGIFIETAQECLQHNPALQFVIPAANAERKVQLQTILQAYDGNVTKTIKLIDGNSHQAMAASELVLMASGTTTLEAMLLKKPMVVAYRMAPLSYKVISSLLRAPFISLPNLLANKALVPEFLQDEVVPKTLAEAVIHGLEDTTQHQTMQKEFIDIHKQLRLGASKRAARVLLDLIKQRQTT